MVCYLKARKMGESELHLVLVKEVLGHGALHGLAIIQLQGEALHLSRAPRNIAHLGQHNSMIYFT